MILKKSDPRLSRLAHVCRKIVFITGFFSLFLMFLGSVLLFGPHSLFGKTAINKAYIKYKNVLIGEHFAVNDFSSFKDFSKNILAGLINSNDFPIVELKINQTSILSLHSDLANNARNYVPATLDVTDVNGDRNKYKAKVRPKGDRLIHRENIRDMSYRVNLKGDDLFIGAEEFSLQHPVARNFTWEPLIADIAKDEGILSLSIHPVNFSVNGSSRGVYFFEEVPSKFTVERQMRKDGPIFGLDENANIIFPNVSYEVYEEKKWLEKDEKTYLLALNKLNMIKLIDVKSPNYNEEVINDIFDMELWAKFFALIDRFGAYHGSVPKSVKLYYSPVTGKFEPLLFDAHVGAGKFDQFSFSEMIDYSTNQTVNCEWICRQHNWYELFFNRQNSKFLQNYFMAVDRYLSNDFSNKIKSTYAEKFLSIDQELYASFYLSDKIFYRGFTYYYFDDSWLDKRKAEVSATRRNTAAKMGSWLPLEPNATLNDTLYSAPSELTSASATVTKLQGFSFSGSSLNFSKPGVLILSGKTSLRGISESVPLTVSGPIMIVQMGGEVEIENVVFNQLKYHQVDGRNWSGGVNIIDSVAILKNVSFNFIDAEDSLNSVNSSLESSTINITGSKSDALDVDFGSFNIERLICEEIGNDCLDVSGATGQVSEVYADGVADKLISAGESSDIHIDQVSGKNIGIGAVSKDSSNLVIEMMSLKDTSLEGAVFNKKQFFGPANLTLTEVIPSSSNAKILIGDDNTLDGNLNLLVEKKSSLEIEQLMYGNIYGKATVK